MTLHTFTAGEKLTASNTNSFLSHTGAAWDTWTPVLGQGVNVTFTTTNATYHRAGRLITAAAVITCTSSGTANATIAVSLPVTAAYSSNVICGQCFIYDISALLKYKCQAILTSTSQAFFQYQGDSIDKAMGLTGSAFALALASGDTISVQYTYEAAAG